MTATDAATPPGAADAAAPPVAADAAVAAGPVVRLAPTRLLTGADLTSAEVLAADADGIYWVTSANELWMLPVGSDAPRELAADPNPPAGPTNDGILFAAGNDLLWSARWQPGVASFQNSLHRTRKTGGDVVLIADLLCDRPQVAADDAYLYYPQGAETPNGFLAALPLDADPGAAPIILTPLGFDMVVASLAVDDRSLYWTIYPIDSTIHVDRGPVVKGDKASLLAGKQSDFRFVDRDVSFMRPSGSTLYYDYAPTPDTARVGRADAHGVLADLPLPVGNTLLVLDGWAVSATTAARSPNGKIYAAPAAAAVGDGVVAIEIADYVLVAPVVGPPGLVFVDGGGHLLAVSGPDLGAAVLAGQR